MIKRWIRKWLQENSNEVYPVLDYGTKPRSGSPVRVDDAYGAVSFRVVHARGGKIVESMRWDPKTDRETTTVYIIGDDEDFSSSLGKIITMESLK